MREIKFRAWDKTKDKMTMIFAITGRGEMLVRGQEGWEFAHGNRAKSLEVMQYTGLTDINGKKIYEGDIIETYDNKGYWEMNSLVYWCNHSASWESQDVPLEYYSDCFPLENKAHFIRGDVKGDLEVKVIGNIYENGYLLEGMEIERKRHSVSKN